MPLGGFSRTLMGTSLRLLVGLTLFVWTDNLCVKNNLMFKEVP